MQIIKNIKELIDKFNIRFYLFIALVLFLPINQKVSTILLIVNIVFTLPYLNKIKQKHIIYVLLFSLLYFLYVFANYRDFFVFDGRIFERKASLLAIPFIVFTQEVNKKSLETILKYFVYGCIVSYIISIGITTIRFFDVSYYNSSIDSLSLSYLPLQTNPFLGNSFSYDIQGTYIAIYYVLAIGVMLFKRVLLNERLRWIFTAILMLGVFQVFSIVGILALSLLLLYYILKKATKKQFIIATVLVLSLSFFLKERVFKEEYELVKQEMLTESRITIWEHVFKISDEKVLFGHGYKKAQNRLNEVYPKGGKFGELTQRKNYNAHNTFLQTYIEVGLIGLVILITLLLLFFKNEIYIKASYNISVVFLIVVSCISMTESILNIYAGISFFTFFFCLLINSKNEAL